MSDVVLEVKNLTKKFGTFTAVNDISFSIQEGEILGILGPNGAGKTTTIQMLLGVMGQTEGSISFFGKPLEKNREEIMKKINFASTYIHLPRYFTILEILTIFARLYEIPNREKRITILLDAFELSHLAKKSYDQLSAGEKTRLVMTKAFLNYPKLILLDEPTASLDPEIAKRVREFLLKEKNEFNTTILLTSHNMAEVEEMCDRVIIINHGKIIAEDKPENLTKQLTECQIELTIIDDSQRARDFFDDKKFIYEKNKHYFSVTLDEKNISDFLTLLSNEKITFQEISINKPDLEDFFLQIIEKGGSQL